MDTASAIEKLHEAFCRSYHEMRRPDECIFCRGKKVWWNGTRTRSATGVVDGRSVTVPSFRCRRVRCAACGKSWTLLPEGLVPRRHFHLAVGTGALSAYLAGPSMSLEKAAAAVSFSARTLGRFRDWVAKLALPAVLDRLVAVVSRAPILVPLLPVTDPRRKARRDGRRLGILERAAQVLSLTETLGAALGLVPPGLAALLTRVLRGPFASVLVQGGSIPAQAWRQAAVRPVIMPG